MPPPIQAASIAAWGYESHVSENRTLYQAKFNAVLDILKPVMALNGYKPDFISGQKHLTMTSYLPRRCMGNMLLPCYPVATCHARLNKAIQMQTGSHSPSSNVLRPQGVSGGLLKRYSEHIWTYMPKSEHQQEE